MTPPLPSRRTWLPLALAALALSGSSCNRGPACYPVRGRVLVDGRPAEGARVIFVPADAHDPLAPRPSGITAADGSFALRTYDPASQTTRDGAPPGTYVATVLWPPESAREQAAPDHKEAPPDQLRGRYADPANSSLRGLEVKEGPNELPPFTLSAAARKGGKS
jgi:hypothetical protein